jgi:hypothetical protein
VTNLGPLKRWRGNTWVGWLNTLVLRWLCIRLAYRVEGDNTISGWGYVWAWPWARRGSRARIWPKQLPPPSCDHGVSFNEDEWREASIQLAHRAFPSETERQLAIIRFGGAVRKRWPRLDGDCPKACGYHGIAYASKMHYVAGDW